MTAKTVNLWECIISHTEFQAPPFGVTFHRADDAENFARRARTYGYKVEIMNYTTEPTVAAALYSAADHFGDGALAASASTTTRQCRKPHTT